MHSLIQYLQGNGSNNVHWETAGISNSPLPHLTHPEIHVKHLQKATFQPEHT